MKIKTSHGWIVINRKSPPWSVYLTKEDQEGKKLTKVREKRIGFTWERWILCEKCNIAWVIYLPFFTIGFRPRTQFDALVKFIGRPDSGKAGDEQKSFQRSLKPNPFKPPFDE